LEAARIAATAAKIRTNKEVGNKRSERHLQQQQLAEAISKVEKW